MEKKLSIGHKEVVRMAASGLFAAVSGYEDLVKKIDAYGGQGLTEDEKNERLGLAFEVYAEYFLKRFSGPANPFLGVQNVRDTSDDKHNSGYDFLAEDLAGETVHVQVKFYHEGFEGFTRKGLGTFVSRADEEGVPAARRLLFTSLRSAEPFHYSYPGGRKQMRVLSRRLQEELIDRSPGFWADFCSCVIESAKAPVRPQAPELWPHQSEMLAACGRVLRREIPRGKVICATGGGKTRVEFEALKSGFADGGRIQVVVAPTIDLLKQHHVSFSGWGMFRGDGVVALHFRSGTEPEAAEVRDIDYVQTLDEDALLAALAECLERKKRVLIFTTFASEQRLFEFFRGGKVNVNLAVFDEFHHCVKQETSYREHLLSLPADRLLFFSASEKRGRVVSSMDKELFGEKLFEISFGDLRRMGYLVPVVVKAIRLDAARMAALEDDLRKAAEREGFDLRTALMEAGAVVVARRDLLKTGRSNIITFSKKVAICEEIVKSKVVREHVGAALLQTVSGGVNGRVRQDRIAKMKGSDDSIMCQHSVMREGIDNPAANGGVFSRGMEPISVQQSIGRLVRILPEDRAKLLAGEISLDSLKGWKKPFAVAYLVIHDESSEEFEGFLRDFVEKLLGVGLAEDDFQFAELAEERHGVDGEGLSSWIASVTSEDDVLEGLGEFVKHVFVDIDAEQRKLEEEERKERELARLGKLTMKELRQEHRSNPSNETRTVINSRNNSAFPF